jgi:ribosomal protein S18 acetylase RimI-like enzyme
VTTASASDTEVRNATAADVPRLSVVLARAFHDDPIMSWIFPRTPDRIRELIRFYSLAFCARLRRGDVVLTTSGVEAGAVWAPPDRWKAGVGEIVRELPGLAKVFARRPLAPIATLVSLQHHHPTSRHWYLNNLGTDPISRRRGRGTALLEYGLARCDQAGVGAFLETANPSSLGMYTRSGFVVVDEMDLPFKGPHVWSMWREPRVWRG